MSGTLRQLEERQLPSEVTVMKWSPKMDLLAVANAKGEVALHRLTWQRVWLLSPPNENDTCINLAWRPDGKLLAITYQISKLFYLVDIENKNIIHKTKLVLNAIITCVTWLPIGSLEFYNTFTSNKDCASSPNEYLPPLPSLNRSFTQEPERKEFLSQTLDMLLLGDQDGNVVMYVFGMFYCGTIPVGKGPILDISGNSSGIIWVTLKDNGDIVVNRLSCLLLEKSTAFFKVAQAQANIECSMDYLSRTLMAMSEAWETILLEMDEKLTRYAETNPPGGVAADFLELLMIGIPRQNLENFLLRDLTEKGLKKLGHSIEICYSNIQKLVLKNLTSVGMAIVYQLAEMRGMVRFGGLYESLGLKDENLINNAIHASEAFLAKSSEIQQVIDHSMRNYKAFFRWLHFVILRLTDERIPSEVNKLSQQELTFIAEFLRGFDKTDPADGSRKGVNLEKLGQYLRREPLQTCLSPQGSEWATMLEENQCFRDHPLVVKQDLNFSLLQSHAKLVAAINDLFGQSYQGLVHQFRLKSISLSSSANSFSQIITSEETLLIAACDNDCKTLRMFKVECAPATLTELCFKLTTISMDNKDASYSKSYNDSTIAVTQFYSHDYLSILLLNQENCTSSLVQLPLCRVWGTDSEHSNVYLSDLIGSPWPRPFHGISARRLAVSSARKVAAILSDNGRKIRLLETEVEPEEEEDDDDEDEDNVTDNMMDTTTSGAALNSSVQ